MQTNVRCYDDNLDILPRDALDFGGESGNRSNAQLPSVEVTGDR